MMRREALRFTCAAALCLVSLLLAGCRRGERSADDDGDAGTLRLFAAASLTEPFAALARAYEESNPGATVELSFAGTQQLLLQLEHGASADLFATADADHMRAAERAGLVEPGRASLFAHNRLAIVVPKDAPGEVTSVRDLARPRLRLVVAHDGVPIGRYWRKLCDGLRGDPGYGAALVDAIDANVVSRENDVKAVLAKVRLGEADAGIVYVSDALGAAALEVRRIDLPERHNPTTRYEIAVLARAAAPKAAARFIEFARSSQGRGLLERAGLTVPREPAP